MNLEWEQNTEDNKPKNKVNVLVSFDAHYGKAVVVAQYSDTDGWLLSSDQDGTIEPIEDDIEIDKWAYFNMPSTLQ